MPVAPSYPGVYIEEIPSGVRTIVGVATSITAFIGRAQRGPTNKAITINSYSDFDRIFGGLWLESALGYAVRDFYLNGGSQAIIVRLYHADTAAAGAGVAPYPQAKLTVGKVQMKAANEGSWGANLRGMIDLQNISDPNLFNLTVTDAGPGGSSERFLNLSVANDSPRRIDRVLEAESRLVKWDGNWPPTTLPDPAEIRQAIQAVSVAGAAEKEVKQDALWDLTLDVVSRAERKYARAKEARERAQNNNASQMLDDAKDKESDEKTALETATQALAESVSDGSYLTINDFIPPGSKTEKTGMHALEQADLFNLLCIPPYRDPDQPLDVDVNLVSAAATYCEERRAMLLLDPPKDWNDKATARDKFRDPDDDNIGTRSKNAALFFPRIKQPNPLRDNQMEEFAPCGAIAGIFARTDVQRGVWKAPAGMEATLVGIPQLSVNLTDAENGELNPLGINCLRSFPVIGRIVWGSRTLQGADQLASEWKYVPVRRTALFIEESLYRGTQWVVFEPNDEPLWAQIRLNVGSFMHNLFRQGAFQGKTPAEAYFVKCDKETTTQNDIDLGIVNVVVGFKPPKPAEFVIIKLQQMAGQIQV